MCDRRIQELIKLDIYKISDDEFLIIGPKGSPYHNGFYLIEVKNKVYKFLSKIWHPNIN